MTVPFHFSLKQFPQLSKQNTLCKRYKKVHTFNTIKQHDPDQSKSYKLRRVEISRV